ncbi:MAG: right-handed parallel beta-helix repeat-containing protein [Bacteroidetes bacterium]|nr:right-handed parallel beta-helix repeat-containing protein [Bacteroidota bacterium]
MMKHERGNNRIIRIRVYLFFLVILSNVLNTQPSGGPYGPQHVTYEIPKVYGKLYYVAPNGNPASQGHTVDNPTTIEKAIEQVRTGDVIILRGGIYRTGNLIVNQGITIQPYRDEHPIFKGTFIAQQWHDLGNGLWRTRWDRLFPSKPADWWRREREGKKTPLHKFNNDMVFIDGKFLQSVGWEGEVTEDSYYIDYDNKYVYIGTNPQQHCVEITAFDIAILRTIKECHGKKSDRRGIVLRGITFTQYAYRALEIEGKDPEGISPEKDHGKDVIGSVFEHCTISYCSRVAGYFRGDSMVFRHCEISNTSTEGLYILSSNDVILEKNIFKKNNIENITGYYPAAVKIFNQCYRVTCNDNLVIDHPNSNGIWYDVGNVDGIFVNNWIVNVGNTRTSIRTDQLWPSDNGFFFEISKGAICAGNVFVNCDHGLLILNSSDVQIYNNTFINSMACIGRNARVAAGDHFGWHASTGPDINRRDGHVFVNNLLVADEQHNRPLLFVWQPAALCSILTTPQVKEVEHNVFVTHYPLTNALILWGPYQNTQCQVFYSSVTDFQNENAVANNNFEFLNYRGSILKSVELQNPRLLPQFSSTLQGKKIPSIIRQYLRSSIGKTYIGAYPSIE